MAASIIIDNSVLVDLKSRAEEKKPSSYLTLGIAAGAHILITGLVPVPATAVAGLWPDEASVLGAAKKLRRRLLGNVYIVGLMYSSPDEIKQNSMTMSQFHSMSASLRSLLETNSKLVEHFYYRKSLYERCNILALHNQAKNSISCRTIPECRVTEHSFIDLSARGSWMKAICRISLNTNSVSLVSVEESESSTRFIQNMLEDVLTSIFGDLTKTNVRFHALGKGVYIPGTDDSSELTSVFSEEAPFLSEVELQCQPFAKSKAPSRSSSDAEYFRIAVGGDLEAAVCLHSKYSNISDFYDGLMGDIVFTLADLLSSSLKTFKKDIDENGEEYSLLSLPKRILPEIALPGKEKGDLLNWTLTSYETDSASDLEYIFHRDKVMNDLSEAPKLGAKPTPRGGKKHEEADSLDRLSCSTSYGALAFILGGIVLLILALFVQNFLPDLGGQSK